jgi:glucose/arabinose dehydrogenase
MHMKKNIVIVFVLAISLFTAVVGGTAVLANTPTETPTGSLSLALNPFANGLSNPVSVASADDGYGRLFVAQRQGRIRLVEPNGTLQNASFLNITDRVDSSDSEEGLLGFAFHPNYKDNGYFYVNYTNTTSGIRRTRISRFSVTANPTLADPNSEDILLTVVQTDWNHNAGDIHFGPDGYLYVPLGDGGGGGDIPNNAQNRNLALGKILRIDVNNTGANPAECNNVGGSNNYAIPADNPYVGADGTCDLIWAIGTRNPWRSSFDRLNGDFYFGDVGQGSWEEVDHQPAASTGGENYGWRCYEGNHTYNTSGCGPMNTYDFPILEFTSTGNCAVIGGYVYRGTQYPALYGRYLVTDYCTGNFWDLVVDDTNLFTATMHTNLTTFGYVSFGEADNCELYLANISNGTLYHIQENSLVHRPSGGSALCNNRPLALDDNTYVIEQGQTLVVNSPGVLMNDSDLDLDTFTAVINTNPANGSVNLQPNGSFIYTPTKGFAGTDNFTYRALDSYDESRIATVIITVTLGNTPPVANNDAYTTTIDTPITVLAPGVLDNDSDVDFDVLTAVVDTNPINGIVSLQLDGSFTYTPTAAFSGPDSFTYHANDGLDNSNIATVTLQIIDGNAPPTVISDHYTMYWNTLLNVPAPGILANDSDPNGDALTANLVSTTANGTVDLQANGAFVYTPTLNFSGVDTFSYQAYDGQALSAPVSVIITVTANYPVYLPFIAISE